MEREKLKRMKRNFENLRETYTREKKADGNDGTSHF